MRDRVPDPSVPDRRLPDYIAAVAPSRPETDAPPRAIRVRAVVPHFHGARSVNPKYGSERPEERLRRALALARCLGALRNLGRAATDSILHYGRQDLDRAGPGPAPAIEVEIHVLTCGDHALAEVLAGFEPWITRHRVELADPRELPLRARDFAIAADPIADLTMYLEDDLVIADPAFVAKQLWFQGLTGAGPVLMPHRYEFLPGAAGARLLVDGPLSQALLAHFFAPEVGVAEGAFPGFGPVRFDRYPNPHSGMFCLGRSQVGRLRRETLPVEGFIGPLETAATLTALRFFPVLKPAPEHRHFLWVEHAHPRFTDGETCGAKPYRPPE